MGARRQPTQRASIRSDTEARHRQRPAPVGHHRRPQEQILRAVGQQTPGCIEGPSGRDQRTNGATRLGDRPRTPGSTRSTGRGTDDRRTSASLTLASTRCGTHSRTAHGNPRTRCSRTQAKAAAAVRNGSSASCWQTRGRHAWVVTSHCWPIKRARPASSFPADPPELPSGVPLRHSSGNEEVQDFLTITGFWHTPLNYCQGR